MSGPQWVTTTEHLQAWQVTVDNLIDVAQWRGGRAGEVEQCVDFESVRERIETADVGDWIMSGPAGFFPLPDSAFRRHYQPSGPPPEKPTHGVLTGEPLRITRRTT